MELPLLLEAEWRRQQYEKETGLLFETERDFLKEAKNLLDEAKYEDCWEKKRQLYTTACACANAAMQLEKAHLKRMADMSLSTFGN